jgi:two-component system sensor histidine kinase TctE
LDNAITYAGRGGQITLRCFSEAGAAVLEVEDDGPGIAPADRGRVLQRFQRGAQELGTGSGLGLAIVSDIARAHGARLSLNDGAGNAQGAGLRVRVQFDPA